MTSDVTGSSDELLTQHVQQQRDWYVYDGVRVEGPYSSPELLELKQVSSTRDLVVSRTGYDRWYPLASLAGLMERTNEMAATVADERSAFESQVDENLQFMAARAMTNPAVADKSRKEPVQHKDLRSRTIADTAEAPASTEMPPPEADQTPAPQASPRPLTATLAPASKGRKRSRSRGRTQRKASKQLRELQESPQYSYLVLRGRLRLGEIRSSVGILFGCLWTLGFSWISWFYMSAKEVSWHVSNDFEIRGFPPLFFAVVPGVHLYMTYRLAQLICAAESQNGYRRVSPLFAAFLAVFPPVAMIYLQGHMNRHWLLHVEHHRST